jgi:hypothetical protein
LVLPIDPPANLSATVVGLHRIELKWDDRSVGESGFTVERSIAGAAFSRIGETSGNVTSFADGSAPSATPCGYRVRTRFPAGFSPPSNLAAATIPSGGKLKLTPARLNFGTLAAGRTKDLTLTLSNIGSGDLVGRISGAAPPFEPLSGAGSFSIPRRGRLQVRVRFSPGAAGTFAATLVVESTDPINGVANVRMDGRRR